MRKIALFLCSLLLLTCTSTNPPAIQEKNIPITIYKVAENSYFNFAQTRGPLAITLKDETIPNNAKYMEVTFNNVYQGYFDVKKAFYVPRITGTHRLILIFSDTSGKSLNIRKEFTLTF